MQCAGQRHGTPVQCPYYCTALGRASRSSSLLAISGKSVSVLVVFFVFVCLFLKHPLYQSF